MLFAAPLQAQKAVFRNPADAPPGAELIESYGSYHLYRTQDATSGIDADYMDRLLMDAWPFNTQKEPVASPNGFAMDQPVGHSLQLIQFLGPVKQDWLGALAADGIEPVHYVAHNGYLVWTDQAGRERLDQMVHGRVNGLQFSGVYHSFFKVGDTLLARIAHGPPPGEHVLLTVQMYRHNGGSTSEQAIAALAVQQTDWQPILGFQNARFLAPLGALQAIANLSDVFWVGEYLPPELHDEVQGQIMAGNYNGDMSGPSGPGYRALLASLGFSTVPADYPVVDIVDDGIGNGTVNSGDPTFHVAGDLANPTRLAYVNNCTGGVNGSGPNGHGHINLSIAGGFDRRSGFPFRDPEGFQRGLGINPHGRFAGTRIFLGPMFDLSNCGDSDAGLILSSYLSGARITSNSWGCAFCLNPYNEASQAFDAGVRDAHPALPGNQQQIIIFSAGNRGPDSNTVGPPGDGKNVITVGASENFRPGDEDGDWTDGCEKGPSDADNAMDVADFSSRGPAAGGRVKPELMAPGTHVQGTASTHSEYTGNSVCDQYRPSGQTTFAASSGTSHSAPAIAGLASLAYYWIENGLAGEGVNYPPSPALMKAYLMAHSTYLTGAGANDDLPSNNQGYGQPAAGLLFDDASRYLIDQTHVFDNSGEEWIGGGSVVDPTKPVRVVLAYTDQPGAVGTSPQVNDLNLRVEAGDDTYFGNNFSGPYSITGGRIDAENNYEAVFLPPDSADELIITVDGFNIAGDGVPQSGDGTDQDFALVCYNCLAHPTYTLAASPEEANVCAPASAVYGVTLGSILGFGEPVMLSTDNVPSGLVTGFSQNPVMPPGASQLTVSNTAEVTAGSYLIRLSGLSSPSGISRSRALGLNIFNEAPSAPTLLQPPNGAIGVSTMPTLSWTASTQGQFYNLQIDDDPAFTSTDYSRIVSVTSHTVQGTQLDSLTQYHWRVRALNACGFTTSSPFSFITEAEPIFRNGFEEK